MKYRQIAAYEVRPGILMVTRDTPDGQRCEATVVRDHLTANGVDLGSTIPAKLTEEILDEIVPRSEWGGRVGPFSDWEYVVTTSGNIITKEATYENVLIEIDGTLSSCDAGDIVVKIRWRKKACGNMGPG